jgi:hypothetical protein
MDFGFGEVNAYARLTTPVTIILPHLGNLEHG